MGKTSVGYFKAIYKITECRARSKNEGLKLIRDVMLNSYDLRKIHEPNLKHLKILIFYICE